MFKTLSLAAAFGVGACGGPVILPPAPPSVDYDPCARWLPGANRVVWICPLDGGADAGVPDAGSIWGQVSEDAPR